MYSLRTGSLLFSPAFGQIRIHVNMPKIVPLLLQKNNNRTYRKCLTRGHTTCMADGTHSESNWKGQLPLTGQFDTRRQSRALQSNHTKHLNGPDNDLRSGATRFLHVSCFPLICRR